MNNSGNEVTVVGDIVLQQETPTGLNDIKLQKKPDRVAFRGVKAYWLEVSRGRKRRFFRT